MLGRGLESLIPNKSNKEVEQKKEVANPAFAKASAGEAGEAIFQIEIEKITPNPFQPRKDFDPIALRELASSIREFGILQPLLVSKVEKETDRGTDVRYQLIAGERRWQAAKILGLQRVPAIIRAVPQEKEKLEMAIIENVQRENLNSMEAARAYAKLQDMFGLTQREVAARVGKSRETIANLLRLLNLPSGIQEALVKNQVSESQARLLLAVSDPNQQNQLFNDITRNNLSVRELKNRIARINRKENEPVAKLVIADVEFQQELKAPTVTDPELVGIQYTLEEALGAKVKVEKNGRTGQINITFSSPEDLQILINRLLKDEN
ncbi:MAG: ParB/RepB/Spo0J family partition protein [Patescibacteria group bacterium]